MKTLSCGIMPSATYIVITLKAVLVSQEQYRLPTVVGLVSCFREWKEEAGGENMIHICLIWGDLAKSSTSTRTKTIYQLTKKKNTF